MQITVPDIGNQPLKIIVAGVTYELGAGETINVPDAVAAEIIRMTDAMTHDVPPAEAPFESGKVEQEITALDTRLSAAEEMVLPDFPDSDGTYMLLLVMDDGAATLTWEAVEDNSGSGGSAESDGK